MRKPHEGLGRGRLVSLLLLLGLFLYWGALQFAQARLSRTPFKEFAEARASEIFKAPVKIKAIRLGALSQIVFEGIEIHSAAGQAVSILELKRLVFGYGLVNLIRGDFKVPSRIVLEAPMLRFQSPRKPLPFLDSAFASAPRVPAELVIRQGELRYPWGEGGEELKLSGVQFKAKLNPKGRVEVRLSAKLAGVAEGEIKLRGTTDLPFEHYELEASLEGVSFLAASGIPMKSMKGEVSLSDRVIQTRGLTSLFHDWEVEWKGKIEEWQGEPRADLEMRQESREGTLRFSVQADFAKRKLGGSLGWRGKSYPFTGTVLQEGPKIHFLNLALPRGYTGRGVVDRSNGNYEAQFHRERRRFEIHSNLSELGFKTQFALEHVSVANLDWVVSGEAQLVPLPKASRHAPARFRGTVKTDTLIMEYEPFHDFHGTFELSREGIHEIDCDWGEVFHLDGRILFKGSEPRKDLVLRVEGFPLETVQDFGGRPLPSNLSGRLQGKLKLRGELNRPDVEGYFTIEEGTLEKLDFDQAILKFRGFPPYLKLYDSKILRGRNTLKMTGAIDLSLANVFHGIRIKGPDHLVIWRGMNVGWKEGESAIQAEKPLGQRMTMGLEMGAGGDSQKEGEAETHALLGPKVKF